MRLVGDEQALLRQDQRARSRISSPLCVPNWPSSKRGPGAQPAAAAPAPVPNRAAKPRSWKLQDVTTGGEEGERLTHFGV